MVDVVQKTLRVPSVTKSLREVRDFVKDAIRSASLDDQARRHVLLGIDEAVTNIVTYRSNEPVEAEIVIRIDVDRIRVRVVIEDHGDDVDPGPLSLPELEKALRGEGTRCVGIFLIRQVMDEVSYRFKKGFQNELELIKFTR